jgi:hypothetical protein
MAYHLRSDIASIDALDEWDASSSIGPDSSPDRPLAGTFDIPDHVPFLELDSEYLPEDDEDDYSYMPGVRRLAERKSNEEKVLEVLKYMKDRFPRFSLRLLLQTIFTSQAPAITNYANIFLADGGALELMDSWWDRIGFQDHRMNNWIVERAGQLCAREFGWLTENASKGPHYEDAKFLRVTPQQATITLLRDFSYDTLCARYERVTPSFQHILKCVIGKTGPPQHGGSRNPDYVSDTLFVVGRNWFLTV